MPNPRRSWFCRLRRICLLLVLGLGTTIAVAWAAEAWSPMREWDGDSFIDPPAEWFVDVPSHWPTAPEDAFVSRGIGRAVTTALADEFSLPLVFEKWAQEEVRVGLPLRSLRRMEFVFASSGQSEDALRLSRVQTGVTLPAWLGVDPTDDRSLPLMPLWPGLVANTLFYALLLWLGLAQWYLVICNRRYRRGLCPICRYDIKFDNAAGCPECGWRRE